MSFLTFVHNQRTPIPLPTPPMNIKEQTYIVTGANTGLGYECTKHLFLMGAKRIILAVRSISKGEAALQTLRTETGRRDAGEVWTLDLMNLASVEAFAERLSKLDRLDGLIANAGVVMAKHEKVEGMELSLVVNFVSTMLLSLRSIPKLEETAKKTGEKTHLAIVSSNTALEAAREKSVSGIVGDVLDGLSDAKGFKVMQQYPTTKLLGIYAVRELASLLPVSKTGVIVNAVSPGLCYSELDRNAPAVGRAALAVMRALLARTTEVGSRTLLDAAFARPESHGAYCSECQVKNDALPAWMTNEIGQRTQKRVWDDLLKRLDSMGHKVDVRALTA